MKKLLWIFLLTAIPVAAQVNVSGSQIQIGGTGGDVSTVKGTTPITVNGTTDTPQTGDVDVACPSCGAGLGAETGAGPIAGQYVIVYPTGATPASCGSSNSASGNDKSGQLYMSGAGSCGNSSVTWTFNTSALPAGVPIGNVTAVYPFVVAASTFQNNLGAGNYFDTSCTGNGVSLSNNRNDAGYHTNVSYPLEQYTSSTSLTVSAANFNAMSCSIVASMTDSAVGDPRIIQGNATLVGAYVYYTGTPVTQPSQVYVQAPLNFNSSASTLSLPLPYDAAVDFGTANAYSIVNSAFTQAVSGLEVKFYALNASSSTAPTLNVNGWGNWTIVGPTGGALSAGDITAYATSYAVTRVMLGGNNEWFLENPQVSGGSSISLTTTGTSGAATLSGNTLNIPNYATIPNPMNTLGDMIYGAVAGAQTRLPGNTSASTECLTQTGTGSASAAPAWGSCAGTGGSINLENGGTSLGTITTLNCGTGTTCAASSGTGTITVGAAASFAYSPLPASPSTSSFTNVNFLAGTTLVANGSPNTLFMQIANSSALNWQFAKYNGALPSTPWMVEGLLSCFENTGTTSYINSADCGLYLYDGTKLEGSEFLYQSGVPGNYRVEQIASVTTDGSTKFGPSSLQQMNDGNSYGKYVGFCYDGTNVYPEVSMDGANWWHFYEDTSGFIVPTSVGFGGVMISAVLSQEMISLKGFNLVHVSSCP